MLTALTERFFPSTSGVPGCLNSLEFTNPSVYVAFETYTILPIDCIIYYITQPMEAEVLDAELGCLS